MTPTVPRLPSARQFRLAGRVVVVAMLGLVALLPADATCAPSITNVAPPALQIGATTTLRIDGGDLAANPRLLLPVALAEQKLKAGGSANRVEIEVKLDATVAAGVYLVRVATDSGVSNAFPLAIDALPNLPVQTNVSQMPSALVGDVTGSNVVHTTFVGQKDQPIIVEVESRRLGGRLNPVIRLLDERGVQIAWAQGERRLGGDARLSVKLPAAGTYAVELHDLLFRGEGPGRFRLKIGQWKYADLVLPLGIQRGTAASVAFVGGNIERSAIVDARLLAPGMRPATWPVGVAASGGCAAIVVSDHPELIESDAFDAAGQMLAVAPIAVSGRISAQGEEDRFTLPVTPGQALRLELMAERLGSPLDGVLFVRNSGGGELARGDDQPGTTDPQLDFKAPDGVNSIVLAVSDLLGRGGDGFVYRLAATPAGQGSFSPTVPQDVASVAVGGRTLVRVAANRAGFDGPIRLNFAGLPTGIAAAGAEIPAGIDQALLVLAATQPAAARVALSCEATIDGASVARAARAPDFPAARTQPWLREDLAVAAAGAAPLAADWSNVDGPLNIAAGGKLAMPIKIVRAAGTTGPVRLSLVTSQTVPQKKVDNREVDDEAKALRAEAIVVVPPEASEGTVQLVAPADLKPLAYDIVIQADLLSADGQKVAATTFTLPRRVAVGAGQ